MGITEKYLAWSMTYLYPREGKKIVFGPVVFIAYPGGNAYFATCLAGREERNILLRNVLRAERRAQGLRKDM